MHNSSYSRAKFGLETRGHKHKPKGKSCGYYMRIVFFFSSLIQSLIIVSLVLFLVYGQPEKSAEEKMVEELELNFNRISDNNIQLRKEKGELGAQLGARTAEKAALETELAKLKISCNKTESELNQLKAKKTFLSPPVIRSPSLTSCPTCPVSPGEYRRLQTIEQQLDVQKNMNRNFTYMIHYLSKERDDAVKDRDTHNQESIRQLGESTQMKEQLTAYTKKCKEDFAQSLVGIESVTSEFLKRIENLFPHQMTFHLTCENQKAEMEMIRNSCTNLSRDVEKRFQVYLNTVGDRVSKILAESSELQVRNSHCERDYSKAAQKLQEMQATHDDKVEKLLKELMELRNSRQQMPPTQHKFPGK